MDFTDREPIYKQISDNFCQQILKKEWTPKNRVPSVRKIAVQMEVNPNTAMRAFQLLQEKGILNKQRGVGHFIADNAYEKTLRYKRNEFIENDVPEFFRKMNVLGFTCDELEKKHNSE